VFTLNLMRGGPESAADRVLIRDPREWTIFLVDRPDPRQERYRARLATVDGQRVGDVLMASLASRDTLAIAVPPGLLVDGEYVLALEAEGDPPARDLARYRIRASSGS
jgi:hypothetical protein